MIPDQMGTVYSMLKSLGRFLPRTEPRKEKESSAGLLGDTDGTSDAQEIPRIQRSPDMQSDLWI